MPAKMPAGKMVAELVRCFVISYMVAHLIENMSCSHQERPACRSLSTGSRFRVTLLAAPVIWEGMNWKLAAIHAGDWLVKLLLVPIIVVLMHRRRDACTARVPALRPVADYPAGQAQTPPAREPGARARHVHRRVAGAGEPRLINVHVPAGYSAGTTIQLPVLYMPDGGVDEDFPHVVNTVDSLIARHAIRPVIVVGIPNTERRRDLTGPTRLHSDSAIAPHVGGSAAFRAFIRDELIPAVARAIGSPASAPSSVSPGRTVRAGNVSQGAWALQPLRGARPERLVERRRPGGFRADPLAGRDSTRRSLFLASSSQPEIAAGTQHLATMLAAIPPMS